MNAAPSTLSCDSTPDAAIAAVLKQSGPVLVDLDETLYLSNSTEDFIDSARPGLPARLILKLLEYLKPWRWTGGLPTRDVWRVGLVVVLFPWTIWYWKRRVTALATRFNNHELVSALKARDQDPVIVTVGFKPIVTPLIRQLGFGNAKLIASRWFTFTDRRRGKLQMTTQELGVDSLETALFITDSLDDLPMLDRCGQPMRVVWPEARYTPALSGVYLPGEYLSKIKRPNSRYIIRGVIQEDFAFWVLSTIALAAQPLTHVAGLLLLLVSFWAIYERGYVDNDLVAARYESNPKLSRAFWTSGVSTSLWQAWAWALGTGALGIVVLRWRQPMEWYDYAKWLGLLLATHSCYWLFNRLDKTTRVWMYGWLQLARSAAFLVLTPAATIGVLALGSNALARWVSYFTYRFATKDSWPHTQPETTRLLFFAILTVTLVAAEGGAQIHNMTALALLAWYLFRARNELKHILLSARRLDRSDRQPGK